MYLSRILKTFCFIVYVVLNINAQTASIITNPLQESGLLYCFDASQSAGTNPMGEENDIFGIKNYRWDFGDGTVIGPGPYECMPTHTYADTGTYTVNLTVTDFMDRSAADTTSVTVVENIRSVDVSGNTGADIADAIASLDGRAGIVNVPAGNYFVSSTIVIPPGTILAGTSQEETLLSSTAGTVLSIEGNNVRVTGLTIEGPGSSGSGIQMYGRYNVMIDSCNIHGFSIANTVSSYSSACFESNFIHNNPTAGLGYGIMVISGGYCIARNNTFSSNRHSIAAGGHGSEAGWNTGYDCIDNLITLNENSSTIDVHLDAHAGTQGRIRIVNNIFRDIRYGIGLRDGWGEIIGNTFENVTGYICKFDEPVYSDGNMVPGGGCHDFNIRDNSMSNCGTYWRMLYGMGDILINGRNIDDMIPYEGNAPWDETALGKLSVLKQKAAADITFNSVSGILSIYYNRGVRFSAAIFAANGRRLYYSAEKKPVHSISTQHFNKGMVIVTLKNEEGRESFKVFIY